MYFGSCWVVAELTSGNGVTAYMVVRGDPIKVVSVHLVRRCTPWTLCNKNINVNGAVDVVLTKDEADHDVVAAGAHEVISSKAVRKTSEHWMQAF